MTRRVIQKLLIFFWLGLIPVSAHARVENPSAFIGEVVNGATAGAPLAVSSTGKLSSGIPYTEVTATAATTTTATTDGVMNGMTTTPVAGTYLVNFSTWCSESNGNTTVTISLYFNGAQKTDSVRTLIPFDGAVGATTQDMPVSINGVIAANGTNAVTIDWHVSGGTGTCTQRTLDLVRLQ